MDEESRALAEQLVQQLAAKHGQGWERIVVNWELRVDAHGDYADNVRLFAVEEREGDLVKTQDVRTGPDDAELVHRLHAAMAAREPDPWSTMDLVVDADGAYAVDFDYGPPRRLNGIRDERSVGRFRDYLTTYRAERAAKQG